MGQRTRSDNRPVNLVKHAEVKCWYLYDKCWLKPNGRMMNFSCPVLYSYKSPQGRFFFYPASWREREAEWHMNQLKDLNPAPVMRGGNSLFHVLISPFALLKCWHLEVSFAGSRVNCFQSDTSKAAFSIPLACLATTQPTAAAPTAVDKRDLSCATKSSQRWKQSHNKGSVNDIYWFVYQYGEYNMRLEAESQWFKYFESSAWSYSVLFSTPSCKQYFNDDACESCRGTTDVKMPLYGGAFSWGWRAKKQLSSVKTDKWSRWSLPKALIRAVVPPSCGCREEFSPVEWVQVLFTRNWHLCLLRQAFKRHKEVMLSVISPFLSLCISLCLTHIES